MPVPPLSERVAAARARALAQRQLRAPAPPWAREAVQRVEDRLPPAVRAVRWRAGPRAAAGALLAAASSTTAS
ncbi:hypothetical protein, partial [Kineococcus indalonis]|uniref:hypothetical protein n=1 Tax=Kineococcus indalonis TaxID=2696566 RepID=UPI0014131F67